MRTEIRRLISDELKSILPDMIKTQIDKLRDELALERVKEDNKRKEKEREKIEDDKNKDGAIAAKENQVTVSTAAGQLLAPAHREWVDSRINLAIQKKIIPAMKDLTNYMKLTMVDGEEEITRYRREQFDGAKGRGNVREKMLTGSKDYNELVDQIKQGRVQGGTSPHKHAVNDILFFE